MPHRVKFAVPKRGPFNKECIDFIERMRDRFTPEQIALQMGVNTSRVIKYLEQSDASGVPHPAKRELRLADELEMRPEWAGFKEQFSKKELDHFKYRYVQLMGQFRDDILPTEEIQVYQVITLDILIQRTLREQKTAVEAMERLSVSIEGGHKALEGVTDRAARKEKEQEIGALEGQYRGLSDTIRILASRHESYLMRQSAILKDIKGTRDQRVKIFENSKQSFLGYLRAIGEEDFREKEGRIAGLMKAAAEKKAGELARPHTYADGSIDRPLLTPESVLLEDEEEETS